MSVPTSGRVRVSLRNVVFQYSLSLPRNETDQLELFLIRVYTIITERLLIIMDLVNKVTCRKLSVY